MSIAKLSGAFFGAIKEVGIPRAKEVAVKVAQKSETKLKNAIDALAMQGRTTVHKFDLATNNAAQKIENATVKAKNEYFDSDNLADVILNPTLLFAKGKNISFSVPEKDLQNQIDDMLKSKLSYKSAKESAEVFMSDLID